MVVWNVKYYGVEMVKQKQSKVLHEKINKKFDIKLFHSKLCFQENRVWKFIKYTWGWLVSDWIGANDRSSENGRKMQNNSFS